MNAKSILIIIGGSIFLQVLLSPLRAFLPIELESIFGFLSCFLYAWVCNSKFRNKFASGYIVAIVICGILLIQMPIRIMSFSSTVMTLPDMLIHILGALTFYFFKNLKGYNKYLAVILLFTIPAFMALKGYDLWRNKLDNNTFFGRTSMKEKVEFMGIDAFGKTIHNATFNSKFAVLNFWFIGCKPCLEEFPELERFSKKYKNNPQVSIYAVNLPTKFDEEKDAFKLLTSKGYTFSSFTIDTNFKTNPFAIKSCPTTIILNKNGEIIFKGQLALSEKYLSENL